MEEKMDWREDRKKEGSEKEGREEEVCEMV